MEGPIFGRAYVRREICIIKSVGLACSEKEIYHLCFVLLCIRAQIPSTSPLGGLFSEGQFNGGFFALRFWGLLFRGAYFQNFTVFSRNITPLFLTKTLGESAILILKFFYFFLFSAIQDTMECPSLRLMTKLKQIYSTEGDQQVNHNNMLYLTSTLYLNQEPVIFQVGLNAFVQQQQ